MSTATTRRDHTTRNKVLVLALIAILIVLVIAWVATLNIAFFWVALVVLIVGIGAINGLSKR